MMLTKHICRGNGDDLSCQQCQNELPLQQQHPTAPKPSKKYSPDHYNNNNQLSSVSTTKRIVNQNMKNINWIRKRWRILYHSCIISTILAVSIIRNLYSILYIKETSKFLYYNLQEDNIFGAVENTVVSFSSNNSTLLNLSIDSYRQDNSSIKQQPYLDTIPNQVVEQYISWHSSNVLRGESSQQIKDRKFAIVYFSCPFQAGNRIHHFLNSMIWAVVTNRTLLFQYYDTKTCLYHQKLQSQIWHDPGTCTSGNLEQECNDVVHRAEWIPLLSEWAALLSGTETTNTSELSITLVDYWSTRSYHKAPQWERNRFPLLNTTLINPRKIDEMDNQVVDFPMIVGRENILGRPFLRKTILKTQSAQNRARLLFSEGVEFLYGMLFKEAFTIRDQIKTPLPYGVESGGLESSTFSIALHSRHQSGSDGTWIQKETNCIDQMLKTLSLNTTCHICLMSDRPVSIKLITLWVQEKYNCSVYTTNYGNSSEHIESWLTEHGPNAGSRFFRDLDLCQHFIDGFIGKAKGVSSTQLLEEWITYNRLGKHLHIGNKNDSTPSINKCWI